MRNQKYTTPIVIHSRRVVLLLLFSLCFFSLAHSQTYYVKPAAAGSGNGSSWANAAGATQLQAIITAAAAGSKVWVAAGTYKPGTAPAGTATRDYTFLLKNDVAVYGGFAGTETALTQRNVVTNVTILSGDIGTAGTASDNCYHVVLSVGNTAATILDGFAVQGGNANGTGTLSYGGGVSQGSGGGIGCFFSSNVRIANCIIRNNSTGNNGAGLYCSNSSRPDLSHCSFLTNAATNSGGAIGCEASSSFTIDSSYFNDNIATVNGGGIYSYSSSYTIDSCTFDNNRSTQAGAAIYNESGSNTFTTNCVIKNNSSATLGGGIYNKNGSAPTITNCIIQKNTAVTGAGMYNLNVGSPKITYCSFLENKATISGTGNPAGAGMYNDNTSNPELKFCLFSANTAPNGGDGAGMYNNGGATPMDSACVFVNNVTTGGSGGGVMNNGGGAGNPKFFNCVFANNSATLGGGVSLIGSNGRCTNCTFYGNTASTDGGGAYVSAGNAKLINDIFWGNLGGGTQGIAVVASATPSVKNCDVQGGYTGSNSGSIINADPLFINTANLAGADGTWRTSDDGLILSCSSPAKDVALVSDAPLVDIMGIARPQGLGPDMGAYEQTASGITVQPVNTATCAGTDAVFSIAIAGTGVTYQWQVSTNSGSTWTNITDGTQYSGTTTNTLTVLAVAALNSAWQYKCIANSCGIAVASNSAVLTVTAGAISVQPVAGTACMGGATSFSITATGTGLTYQWQVSIDGGSIWNNIIANTIYTGVTSNTLNVAGAANGMNGYKYRCVVSNSTCTGMKSNAVALAIVVPPVISVQPSNAIGCTGSTQSFSVVAKGAGLSYQWQVYSGGAWVNITGAITSTYTITNAALTSNNTQYRVMITNNGCTAVYSNIVIQIVYKIPSFSFNLHKKPITLYLKKYLYV
jgi:hypothetical protein